MGTVRQLAITIEEGLRAALPTLRKTVVTKLALAVGASWKRRPRIRWTWRMYCRWRRNGRICASSGSADC